MSKLPEPWQHKSGYYLNAGGKSIRYEHPESGFVAYIEAMINEEDGLLEYRPSIFNSEGEMVEYPEVFMDKDRAMDDLRELAEEYT